MGCWLIQWPCCHILTRTLTPIPQRMIWNCCSSNNLRKHWPEKQTRGWHLVIVLSPWSAMRNSWEMKRRKICRNPHSIGHWCVAHIRIHNTQCIRLHCIVKPSIDSWLFHEHWIHTLSITMRLLVSFSLFFCTICTFLTYLLEICLQSVQTMQNANLLHAFAVPVEFADSSLVLLFTFPFARLPYLSEALEIFELFIYRFVFKRSFFCSNFRNYLLDHSFGGGLEFCPADFLNGSIAFGFTK